MQTWIVLGSSASAPFYLDALAPHLSVGPADRDDCKLITTNVGLWLLWPQVPDVYFLTDQIACRQYADLAYRAQARGTHLVTLYRDRTALQSRGVDRFDDFLISVSTLPQNQISRKDWPYFVFSGAYCLQYALHRLRDAGGGRLILIGCEGYQPGDSRSSHNKQHLYPAMRSAVEEFAEVEFIFCGRPCDVLPGMQICDTPADLTKAIAT